MQKSRLTMEDIYNAKFKKKRFGGINEEQVDDLLNTIIDDYEYFEEEIKNLKKVNEELRKENFKVKMNALKTNTNTLDLDEVNLNNKVSPMEEVENKVDLSVIEARLNKLERDVAILTVKTSR